MQFGIIKANIVNIAADAIVLPANEYLKEGRGASEAIFEAAGRKALTKACEEIGHCSIGSAVPTLAFSLNAKYIIHAVVPRWIDGEQSEYNLLSSAYLTALNIADAMGCSSIAFPLLASGNNGFDREIAFQVARESIDAFSGSHLNKVHLIVYGDHTEEWVKSMGYTVALLPDQIIADLQKAERKENAKKLLADGKEAAQKFLLGQLAKGLAWLKNEENQEKVIQWGIYIVKEIIKQKNKSAPKNK